ncbi:MAG TPA: toprim domain-containing protein, partial [Pyrinomonadaceae bacterium]|nr:toprim domain-containing protein [Pyrinomonadaceae bacterium]
TSEQLNLLKRFTNNLAIAFDQDAAGNAATVRGLDLARAMDFSIQIITLPPDAGKDPDEAVRKNPQLWKDAIKGAISIMEWIYRQSFRNRHPEKAEEKKLIAREVLNEIRRIVDPVERDHWMKKLASDLMVSEEALHEALRERKPVAAHHQSVGKVAGEQKMDPKKHDPQRELESRIAALVIAQPKLLNIGNDLRFNSSEFTETDLAHLYELLQIGYPTGEQIFSDPESKLFNYLALLAEQAYSNQPLDALERELRQSIASLRNHHKTRERRRLELAMRDAERIGDQTIIADLGQQFESLK